MLQSDTTFDGQYKLLKLLGRGGFSEVWLAEDEYIHLQVVLKVYAPGSGMDDDGIQTIGNEFKLMFNLSHPNLLDPRGFSVYNKMPYLVLPYCTKGSVLNLIGRMDEEQVWRFIAQVAS
ncbi:MAG: protein kinase, partial [Salinivirgaceae bacterium]|nr:protein kinase [Salinivirgaceae bacterium]